MKTPGLPFGPQPRAPPFIPNIGRGGESLGAEAEVGLPWVPSNSWASQPLWGDLMPCPRFPGAAATELGLNCMWCCLESLFSLSRNLPAESECCGARTMWSPPCFIMKQQKAWGHGGSCPGLWGAVVEWGSPRPGLPLVPTVGFCNCSRPLAASIPLLLGSWYLQTSPSCTPETLQ